MNYFFRRIKSSDDFYFVL